MGGEREEEELGGKNGDGRRRKRKREMRREVGPHGRWAGLASPAQHTPGQPDSSFSREGSALGAAPGLDLLSTGHVN